MADLSFTGEFSGFEVDEAGLLDSLKKVVEESLRGLKPSVLRYVQAQVENALRTSPEFTSLLGQGPTDSVFGATLREHFGIADPGPVMEGIVAALRDGVVVDFVPARGENLGGILVAVSRDDYADVLAVPGTTYDSDGHAITWLNWLLMAGDSIILVDTTELNVRAKRAASRTGRAIMQRRNPLRKRHKGEGPPRPVTPWRVPSEFAGTAGDNWLIRTLEPLVTPLERYLAQEMAKL